MGYLETYRSKAEIMSQIKSITDKFNRGKISDMEYQKTMSLLVDAKDNLDEEITNKEQYLGRMRELNNKYNTTLKEDPK